MFNECATSAFQRQGSDRYIGHWSLLPLFDLKHCYQRASADNISRKFGPRSGPTKSLKLIKPDGFPDFFYHKLESSCKNKGADGTARALRVVPAFNKVGVGLNIFLFDQSLLHRYNIKEVGSDSKP